MIKMAFCDDEISVLNQLSRLTDQYQIARNQEISYLAFQSSFELIAELEKGMRVDILFLDVMMPGQNGISAAREIRKLDTNVKIIFLTSSAEFAVDSYTVGAFFYQLKPIWEESFFRLMDSVIEKCEKQQQNALILRCRDGITRIVLEKLSYCEVNGRTLIFHMENGKVHECTGKLDDLSSQLCAYECFLRPHRSYLVNMDYIQNISSKSIIMTDQFEIPVPHGKYSEIKKAYFEYIFGKKQMVL